MALNMYLAGTSKTDITPSVGCFLQGYAARKSEGIHDPLQLKVITIFDGKTRIAVITSDLLYFFPGFVAALRRDVRKKFQMPAGNVFITASHTHTGPCLFPEYKNEQIMPEYLACLRLKIIGGITEAIRNEEKVYLKLGTGRANIGVINRRLKTSKGVLMLPNPQGPVDHQVAVFGVIRPDGSPKAILANYACHATSLGIYPRISADYPGVYQRLIEQIYPTAIACFTNGCCGDVNPSSCSKNLKNPYKRGTFADTERMGKILAAEVIKTFEQSYPVEKGKVEGMLKTIRLPLNKTLLPESVKQVAELAAYHARTTTLPFNHETVQDWKKYWQACLKKHRPIPTTVSFDVQVLKIGNLRIIGLAGEVLVEIGLKIKSRAGDCPLMVCGNANAASRGYIPTTKALQEGGYETSSFFWQKFAAPYAPDMEDTLVNGVISFFGETI